MVSINKVSSKIYRFLQANHNWINDFCAIIENFMAKWKGIQVPPPPLNVHYSIFLTLSRAFYSSSFDLAECMYHCMISNSILQKKTLQRGQKRDNVHYFNLGHLNSIELLQHVVWSCMKCLITVNLV